jgi:hypothetical protein
MGGGGGGGAGFGVDVASPGVASATVGIIGTELLEPVRVMGAGAYVARNARRGVRGTS